MSIKRKLDVLALDDPKNFLWITHAGECMYVSEMATPHIFNALRILFNNTVPPALRVGEFVRYTDVKRWDRKYKQDAISAFLTELSFRTDLGRDSKYELEDMQENSELLIRLSRGI